MARRQRQESAHESRRQVAHPQPRAGRWRAGRRKRPPALSTAYARASVDAAGNARSRGPLEQRPERESHRQQDEAQRRQLRCEREEGSRDLGEQKAHRARQGDVHRQRRGQQDETGGKQAGARPPSGTARPSRAPHAEQSSHARAPGRRSARRRKRRRSARAGSRPARESRPGRPRRGRAYRGAAVRRRPGARLPVQYNRGKGHARHTRRIAGTTLSAALTGNRLR